MKSTTNCIRRVRRITVETKFRIFWEIDKPAQQDRVDTFLIENEIIHVTPMNNSLLIEYVSQ